MFTGIIKTIGSVIYRVEKSERTYIAIKPKKNFGSLKRGDSVSVNGVCLTVAQKKTRTLIFEIMPETKMKTTLGRCKKNDAVNLESALKLGDQLGGHIVQGHIDGIGEVITVEKNTGSMLVSIKIPRGFTQYVILHGSITFDGISLTVARLQENLVTVSLIKETIDRTTWKNIGVGQLVNVEVDVLGKYVEKILTK